MVEAEVRSAYFGDLSSSTTKLKQIITGVTFFLSSGAAATLIGKLPAAVPVVLSILAAVATAYSIAVGLDGRIKTLTKLHAEWNHLSADYERLWTHWSDEDAEETFDSLIRRASDASEIALEMPNDPKRLDKWRTTVYSRFKEEAKPHEPKPVAPQSIASAS